MKDKTNAKMLTTEEAAKYLNVSMPTIYRYLNDNKNPLPSYKITKKSIRIRKEDLDNWIEEQDETEKEEMRDDHLRDDDVKV